MITHYSVTTRSVLFDTVVHTRASPTYAKTFEHFAKAELNTVNSKKYHHTTGTSTVTDTLHRQVDLDDRGGCGGGDGSSDETITMNAFSSRHYLVKKYVRHEPEAHASLGWPKSNPVV